MRVPLCRQQPVFVILPEERTQEASQALCELLGGSLALPTSTKENTRIMHQLHPFSEVCVPTALWKLWLGVKATVPGRLTSLAAEEPLSYQNFHAAANLNNTVFKCVEMRTDGFWEMDYCDAKRCAACGFERSNFLRLRGLCFDEELEARFRVKASSRGRPVLWSYFGLRLAWQDGPNRWQLDNPSTNTTLLRSLRTGSDYPLGRRPWQVASELCGHPADHTLDISLSHCGAGEFICSSGECIAAHRRCNFHHDCSDRSDETDCFVVEKSSDVLLRQVPPPPPPGAPGGAALELESNMTLTRVAAVDDLNMAITLEFHLTLTWVDSRLSFRHLGATGGEATMLSKEDAARLWRPLLHVANLDGGKMDVLSARMQAQSTVPPTQPTFNDLDTGE